MTRAMIRKLLHHPSMQLRSGGRGQEVARRLETVRQLFRLDDD